jgi:hypothetical protein
LHGQKASRPQATLCAAAALAAAASALQESLFSAGVWRAGLVGLLWYAGAFPLLFWQHCIVQVRWSGFCCLDVKNNTCCDACRTMLFWQHCLVQLVGEGAT